MKITCPITNRPRTISDDAVNLLEFLRKYGNWHTVAKNARTANAARELAGLGMIQVTCTGQVRATDWFGNQFNYAERWLTEEQNSRHNKYLESLDND